MNFKENPSKYPLFIPAPVVQYALLAVEGELTLLRKQQQEVEAQEDPDEWPNEYDPNDIYLYNSLLPNLYEGQKEGYEETYWWGKPFGYLMSALQRLLKSKSDIPDDDKMLIARTLCVYYIKMSCWHMMGYQSDNSFEQAQAWAEEHYSDKLMDLVTNLMESRKME